MNKSLNLQNNIKKYLTDFNYMFFILLTTILTYGYFLTHYSLSRDDVTGTRYYTGEMFAQGRFTSTILHHTFGLIDNAPWFIDTIGVLFLILSAILFCILFEKIIPKTSFFAKVIFSTLLITSPLHIEFMSFNSCAIITGLGFCLVALSLLLVEDFFSTKNKKNLILATIFLTICMSWYESLMTAYFSAVFSILILKLTYSNEKYNFKKIITTGLIYAIPFICSILIEFAIEKIIFLLFSIERSPIASNRIHDEPYVFAATEVFIKYIYLSIHNVGIALFNICVLISPFLCAHLIHKKKNFNYIILFFFLFSPIYILAILMRICPLLRQTHAIIYAVAFLIFFLINILAENNNVKKLFFNILKYLSIYAVILQMSFSNYLVNLEWIRSEEEANVVNQIAQKLYDNFDTTKPVVFTGEYEVSNYIQKLILAKPYLLPLPEEARVKRTDLGHSTITWGIDCFILKDEANTELFNVFEFYGHDFVRCTLEMYKEALEISENLPQWPAPGSIIETEKYIIVNF